MAQDPENGPDKSGAEEPQKRGEVLPFRRRVQRPPRPPSQKDDLPQPENQRSPWVGLGVVAALIVVGFFLTMVLQRQGRIEDCLLAHRRNCDALVK